MDETSTVTRGTAYDLAIFLEIAKVAHANNCTFNEVVNSMLADAIARRDEPAKSEETPNG